MKHNVKSLQAKYCIVASLFRKEGKVEKTWTFKMEMQSHKKGNISVTEAKMLCIFAH